MRNLIFAINMTLDGCCDHSKMNGDEQIFEYFTHLMREVDLFLYGRKTYQLMVPFWPDVAKNQSMTKAANELGKRTRIARTGLQDEIFKLKQEPGKNILTGGVSIPSQLIELGVVDEYHVVVHPIVVGEGRRLSEGIRLQERSQLKLVESKVFKSGIVALRYLKQ